MEGDNLDVTQPDPVDMGGMKQTDVASAIDVGFSIYSKIAVLAVVVGVVLFYLRHRRVSMPAEKSVA